MTWRNYFIFCNLSNLVSPLGYIYTYAFNISISLNTSSPLPAPGHLQFAFFPLDPWSRGQNGSSVVLAGVPRRPLWPQVQRLQGQIHVFTYVYIYIYIYSILPAHIYIYIYSILKSSSLSAYLLGLSHSLYIGEYYL